VTSECGLQHTVSAVTSECGLQYMFPQKNNRRSKSSGVFCSVVGLVVPDVLKDPSAFGTLGSTHPAAQHNVPYDFNPLIRLHFIMI